VIISYGWDSNSHNERAVGYAINPVGKHTENSPPLEPLQGVVERLTYHSPDSGYTVARLKTSQERELITIVGNFANIQTGQTLQLSGFWREHPQFGQQFQVKTYQETKPATLSGIEKYLGSGLIKGFGPVTAKRIVAHFGLETLDIIEHHIERLAEVPGIAQKRVEMIQSTWEAQKAIKSVMLFLQSHGVSPSYAVKIYKQYGDESIIIVTQNPYRLATDIYGISFGAADAIARSLSIQPHAESRYRSALLHSLKEASAEGHCFLPQMELIERAIKQLTLKDHQPKAAQVQLYLNAAVHDGELIGEQGSVFYEGQNLYYLPAFFQAEYRLSQRVRRLLNPVQVDLERVKRWIARFIQTTGVTLSQQQRQAVEMAATHRILILTGGPGTGKTFVTRTIVALWKAMGKDIALASPTGRAAQRLSEMTGQTAKTIHRLLEFDPTTMQFKRDLDRLLLVDAVVVDESSMMDLFLSHALVKAIDPQAHLLLVGDTDQLPSVGPGNVLSDLITSGTIPVVKLTEVFRQAATSQIVGNAHLINQGLLPKLEPVSARPESDCLWQNVSDPHQGVQSICHLIQSVIPSLGFNPAQDVQVLCPMMRGEVGTHNLNLVLQALLNPSDPDKSELKRGELVLRVGDRVIQKMNDYNREVFNGDLGIIERIDREAQDVTVRYETKSVTYDCADLNEIGLAWAVTIHKAQGSEYPVVILPVFTQHCVMLSRNLIYTGLTRTQKLAIVVGPQKAIHLAIEQVKHRKRYTLLAERLK
jgi:exodeoxyribonuclease V alpha subunit